MKKQQNSQSTKAFYAEPKCEAMEINLAVNVCSDGQEKLNPVDGGQGGLG